MVIASRLAKNVAFVMIPKSLLRAAESHQQSEHDGILGTVLSIGGH